MKYVLGTNVVARLLDGEKRVLRHLVDVEPRDVGIPLVVFAELYFGAEKSGRREQNRTRIQRMTEHFSSLPMGPAIVRRYAVVRDAVERLGRRKSDFDLIIACTALEQRATLITNDAALKDDSIEGLVVEDWLSTP